MTTAVKPTGAPKRQRTRALYLHRTELELRADDLPKGVCGRVQGIALVYGVPDAYGTQFRKGCLDRTKREKLAAGKVQFFQDHDYGVRTHIGVVRSLQTVGDAEIMSADLFDTEDGRRAKEYFAAVLQAKAQTGLSIGFYPRATEWIGADGQPAERYADEPVLEFTECELEEISSTPRQAVPGADVTGVRSDPALFAKALRGMRAQLGARAFAELLARLDEESPDELEDTIDDSLAGANATADTASHTDDDADSTDASGRTPGEDRRNAASAETRAATMEERIALVRQSYRRP